LRRRHAARSATSTSRAPARPASCLPDARPEPGPRSTTLSPERNRSGQSLQVRGFALSAGRETKAAIAPMSRIQATESSSLPQRHGFRAARRTDGERVPNARVECAVTRGCALRPIRNHRSTGDFARCPAARANTVALISPKGRDGRDEHGRGREPACQASGGLVACSDQTRRSSRKLNLQRDDGRILVGVRPLSHASIALRRWPICHARSSAWREALTPIARGSPVARVAVPVDQRDRRFDPGRDDADRALCAKR
jgi:hypothetical protein